MKIFAKVGMLLATASVLFPPMVFGQNETGPERVLFDSANRERKAHGLAPLHWDSSLARAARAHALVMAKHNSLSHQFEGELDLSARTRITGARFSVIAENVAVGPTAASIHAQWMESSPHRRNLLDPELNSIGIDVAQRNKQLFVIQDFARRVASLSLDMQEKRLSAHLQARGLRVLQDSEEARRACQLGRGYKASRQPMHLLRYSTPELDNLPEPLEQEIRTGRYRAAAVGACSPSHETGLANYELAVLLFE